MLLITARVACAKQYRASAEIIRYVTLVAYLMVPVIDAQGTATGVVNSGQQLLATSRQLNPQLQQLAAMAETSKQLRAQAERLKQLSATVLPQCQQSKRQA